MAAIIASLVIHLHDTGHVEVSGPIENKVLCYGLLGTAHDIIKDISDKTAQQIIAPGAAGLSLVRKPS